MQHTYTTGGGVCIDVMSKQVSYANGIADIAQRLNSKRGVVLTSGFEYPGRYTRFDIGFSDPPLEITTRERTFTVRALNARGHILLTALAVPISALPDVATCEVENDCIRGSVNLANGEFAEEMRSRQPSVFSVLRCIRNQFSSPEDPHLGLYGAFAYDLAFQFEPVRIRLQRSSDQRDLVLFLPDRILTVDHARREAITHEYEFSYKDRSTEGLSRDTADSPLVVASNGAEPCSDHAPGQYGNAVETAREAFARGDLFEAVLGQTFTGATDASPSVLFERLRAANPSPYGALMNLGGEALVSASPEMFVRVEGSRVETCPISGTVARGRDAIEDAERIATLLNSEKDAAELTMCTDVDRNDKSRICVPGSVRIIGRRQLELYSRLIHTVDHLEGLLLPEYDALDAFLTHMWAVTVTGAPKPDAMQFIEDTEKSARRWYGGAIGRITFDGGLNTGLTLRTIRLADGLAEVRVGATLLYDSEPSAEDTECRLKASALFDAIRGGTSSVSATRPNIELSLSVLLIDHRDSFVHTLGDYFRQLGCAVTTLRSEPARRALEDGLAADLVVLSPGPGKPQDFKLSETFRLIEARDLPAFGVCLGLQGMIEYFGGKLDVLAYPMHGKPSDVHHTESALFAGLPARFNVARYHSLYAKHTNVPRVLNVTASTDDGVVMAVEHVDRPWSAVQFHPESLLTSAPDVGLPLLRNVVNAAKLRKAARADSVA